MKMDVVVPEEVEKVFVIKDSLLRAIALTSFLSEDGFQYLNCILTPVSKLAENDHERKVVKEFLNYAWEERRITHGF